MEINHENKQQHQGRPPCGFCNHPQQEDLTNMATHIFFALVGKYPHDQKHEKYVGFFNKLESMTAEDLKELFASKELKELISETFRDKSKTDKHFLACNHSIVLKKLHDQILHTMQQNGYAIGKSTQDNRLLVKKMVAGFIQLKQTLVSLREKQPITLLSKRKHGAIMSSSRMPRLLVNTKDDENKIVSHSSKSLINKLPHDNSTMTCLECREDKSDDSSLDNNNTERKYKKRKLGITKDKLPKKSTRFLKRWLMQNINNPYPDSIAKESMIKTSGLTRKQIQDWFTNARKRYLEPMKKKVVEIAKAQPTNTKRQQQSPAITHNINVQQSHHTTTIKEEKGFSINTTTFQTIQSSMNFNPSTLYGPLPRFNELFNESSNIFSLPIPSFQNLNPSNNNTNHSNYSSLFNRIFDVTNSNPLEAMKKAHQQQMMMNQFLAKQPKGFVTPNTFVPFGSNNQNQIFNTSNSLMNHSTQAAASLHKQKLGMV